MLWNPQPFAQAHESLVALADELSIPAVESILDPIKSDLRDLLSTPAKSDSSRSELAQKSIQVDENVIELNDTFINDAARIADELNLDEITAAKLAFYAIEDSQRLEISIVEAAITLFYVRRQYIINIVRFAVEVLPVTKFGLVLPAQQRVDHIVGALKLVEQSLTALKDRAKSSEFMGLHTDPQFNQLLKLQQSFLVIEHEALGNLLTAYLEGTTPETPTSVNSPGSARGLLDHIATFDNFDSRCVAYTSGIITWLTRTNSVSFNEDLWTYFNQDTQKSKWKLPFLFAGIKLVFCIGLDDECIGSMKNANLDAVLEMVRRSIDDGALEFWMSYVQDVSVQLGGFYFDKYRPLVRSRVPTLQAWRPELDELTISNFRSTMCSFVVSFIGEFADILKEMRLSEEDMYLAMEELDEDSHFSPGVDLERFFLLAALVFRDSADHSAKFFEKNSDEGDILHGFLVWGSSCRATLMAATFAELIGSLANDKATSEAVYEFILTGDLSTVDGSNHLVAVEGLALGSDGNNEREVSTNSSDKFALRWSSILDVLEYHTRPSESSGGTRSSIRGLDYPSSGSDGTKPISPASNFMPNIVAPMPTSNLPPQPATQYSLSQQHTEMTGTTDGVDRTHFPSTIEPLSDDMLLVLAAYMDLISRVASQSTRSHDYFLGKQVDGNQITGGFVPSLLKLLRMNQPINGSIFSALRPFASADMWRTLDSVILGKFDEVLLSLEDALEFLGLLTDLVQQRPLSPKFNEYVDFVFKLVLPWTTSPDAIKGHHHEKTHPASKLSQTDGNMGNTSLTQESALQNVRILIQIKSLHLSKSLLNDPDMKESMFNLFLDSKINDPLFAILCTGLDNIVHLDSDHPLIQSISADVEVLSLLLQMSKPPHFAFDKPILYNLHVIPHIALYAGSKHTDLSLASIKLLAQLDESNEFKATINRQSRILSILSSTFEATRIRVGLMTRMSDLQTPSTVKATLLNMLIQELAASSVPDHYMSVAHYLLGFRQSELGLELSLELDTGIGGIQSGSSLLMVICDLLLHCLSEPHANAMLLKLSTAVLSHLCNDTLTSEMVLSYMRRFDFWINTIRYEAATVSDVVGDDMLEHRAFMLEIWDREIKLCQRKLLLTIESHYIDALVPLVFSLVDLNNIRESSVALRCLSAWCELIPVLLVGDSKLSSQMDAAFVANVIQKLVNCLPQYSLQNADFAEPVANLLVVLSQKFEERGVDNVVARNSQGLFQSSLACMQPAQMNPRLRGHLYTLFCQCLKLALLVGETPTEQGTLNILTDCGPKVFQIACDDILNCFNEDLRFSALLFVQMSAVLGQRLDSTGITQILLTSNFISVFIVQVLEPTVNMLYFTNPITLKRSDEMGNDESNKYRKQTGEKQHKFLRASFSLLLPIAQTREGAENICGSRLLPLIKKSLGSLEDDSLLLVLQILISVLSCVGKNNVLATELIRNVLDVHHKTIRDILQRDASLNRALQNQHSDLSLLAREVTTLVYLTGAKITQLS